MTIERAGLAAQNNAVWCDTVCRVHAVPGEFYPALWLNRHPTPRYYPNAVTLVGAEGAAEQMTLINDLAQVGLPPGWAVKDSFCTIDLAAMGFEVLFEATWIWLERSQFQPVSTLESPVWHKVSTGSDLLAWEAAWAGHPGGDNFEPPIFLPALLADPDVAVLAAYQDNQIIAGAVAIRSGQVVGISNLFAHTGEEASVWADCVNATRLVFPFLPLVGYESGVSLQIASSLGFETIGPLRVWVHKPYS